jgi:uncharacterized protein
MKRVVVAGGTGLIGREFCSRLLELNYEVVILSRQEIHTDHKAVIYARWDGKTVGAWQQYFENASAVVNLSGENIGAGWWTDERKQLILSSRVKAGKAITKAFEMTQSKPAVLLQSSAIGYYGSSGEQIVNETTPAGNDFLAKICLDWEGATQTVELMGVRRVVLRTGIVLSLEAGALPRLLLPTRLFAGGALGSGRQYWSWIHLADQINAMLYLMEHDQTSGVYNLTAPNPVRMSDFGKTLAAVLGRPYWLPVPAFALKLLLGEMSRLLLDSQRILPGRLEEAGYNFIYPEIRPALESLLRQR